MNSEKYDNMLNLKTLNEKNDLEGPNLFYEKSLGVSHHNQ